MIIYSGRVLSLFVSDVKKKKKQGHYARTCIEELCRGCLKWGDECSFQSNEHEVDADDGPLKDVNKEDEEAQERETEMEETQKDEGVRKDQGETNENVIIEDFERSATVKENVGKVSEPPDRDSTGAVRNHGKEDEPKENEATVGEKDI